MMDERKIGTIRAAFEERARNARELRHIVMDDWERAHRSGAVSVREVQSLLIREAKQAAYEAAYSDAADALKNN